MQISFAALPQSIKPQVALRFSGSDDDGKGKTPLNQDTGRPEEPPEFTADDDSFVSTGSGNDKKPETLEEPPVEIEVDLDDDKQGQTSKTGGSLIDMIKKALGGKAGAEGFQIIELGGPNGMGNLNQLLQPQGVEAMPSFVGFEQGYADAITALVTEVKGYQHGQDRDELYLFQAHLEKSETFSQSIQKMNNNSMAMLQNSQGMSQGEYNIHRVVQNTNAMVVSILKINGYEDQQQTYERLFQMAKLLETDHGLIPEEGIENVVIAGDTTKDRVFGLLNLINQAVKKSELFDVNTITVEGVDYPLMTRKQPV